jgi:hypothetical protein
MIRIMTADEPTHREIIVDGKLSGECVELVETLCNEEIGNGKPVQLYLRDVVWPQPRVDRAGASPLGRDNPHISAGKARSSPLEQRKPLPGSAGPRSACNRRVAPSSALRYWWNRVVTFDGGCIQFPDPQLQQAKDPEPKVKV